MGGLSLHIKNISGDIYFLCKKDHTNMMGVKYLERGKYYKTENMYEYDEIIYVGIRTEIGLHDYETGYEVHTYFCAPEDVRKEKIMKWKSIKK